MSGYEDPNHPCNTCEKSLDACKTCEVEDKLYWWDEQPGKGLHPCYSCTKPLTACKVCEVEDKLWSGSEGNSNVYSYGYGTTYVYNKCTHADWLLVPGTDVKLFLGSSGVQIPNEVDVYVRLTTNEPDKPYVPDWLKHLVPETEEEEYLVSWYVPDGDPGPDELVKFCLHVIGAGLQLGFGCIGGHGRTGWLAARILKSLTDMSGDQAVAYLRDKYCSKAVETLAQSADLGLVKEQGSYTKTYVPTTKK